MADDADQRFRAEFLEATVRRLEGDVARVSRELTEVRRLMDTERTRPATPRVDAPPPVPAAESSTAWRRVEDELPSPPMQPPAPAMQPPAPPMRPPAPAMKPPAPPPPPAPPSPPPPPRRTLGELARDWDLVGARGFAIAGGAVMAFGIGLFFVLASNRGWIDDSARVALGAIASMLAFGGGLFLRARFGQYWAALAAVGAGIAGAYATLAAAAARYDLVPDALALPLAGAIAFGATVVAVRWRSRTIAALGLIGAALAPALQALDVALTWESTAFAVIVLLAAGAVCVPLRWRELLISISVIVGLQVEWLIADGAGPLAGVVAVSAAFALGLLAFAVGLQLATRQRLVDPLALTYALGAFAVVLLAAVQVFDAGTDRGIALLAAAAVWAAVFGALQWRKLDDLALAVGVPALALAAVGTADVLVGGTLTLVWAAEAVVLAVVARQLGDARLRAMALAYAALAAVHALVTDAQLGFLFDRNAEQMEAVLPLAAAAIAAAACGLLAPVSYAERTEEGLLRFLRGLRLAFEQYERGIAEALCFTAAAFGTLACSFAFVAFAFEAGHVAASVLAAVVGAAVLSAAAVRRAPKLAVAAFTWLGVVLVEAFAFDVPELSRTSFEATSTGFAETSTGGWSVLAAAAGILGGAYAYRLLDPMQRYADVIHGAAGLVAAVSAWFAVAELTDTEWIGGIGYLAAALVYGALAAAIFTRPGFREASTTLWAIGVVFLLFAEGLLITDSVARIAALAATGLALGALARIVDEVRLWLAGAIVVLLTTAAALLVEVQPWLEEGRARSSRRHRVRRVRTRRVRPRCPRLARPGPARLLHDPVERRHSRRARDRAGADGRSPLDGVRRRAHRSRAGGARAAAPRVAALAGGSRRRGLDDGHRRCSSSRLRHTCSRLPRAPAPPSGCSPRASHLSSWSRSRRPLTSCGSRSARSPAASRSTQRRSGSSSSPSSSRRRPSRPTSSADMSRSARSGRSSASGSSSPACFAACLRCATPVSRSSESASRRSSSTTSPS